MVRLTPREVEIVRLIATNSNQKQIARALGIRTATVKTHINSISKKIGGHGSPMRRIAIYAYQHPRLLGADEATQEQRVA